MYIGNDLVKAVYVGTKKVKAIYQGAIRKLWEFISYIIIPDSTEAYTKKVPIGAEYFDLHSIGGKSVVANQLVSTPRETRNVYGVTFTNNKDGSFSLSGTVTSNGDFGVFAEIKVNSSHQYFFKIVGAFTNVTDNLDKAIFDRIFTNMNTVQPLLRVKSGSVVSGSGYPMLIDLTQMFGAGNEPTLEQCQQIFTDYIPYTEPTIKTICCDCVEVKGKNLLKENPICTLNGNGMLKSLDKEKFMFLKAGTYKFRINNPINFTKYRIQINGYDSNGNKLTTTKKMALDNLGSNTGYYTASGTYLLTANDNPVVTPMTLVLAQDSWIWFVITYGDVTINSIAENSQLEVGTEATDYSPYKPSVDITIPTEVTSLEGYGWSAGTAYNEIDFKNKKFIKRVVKVDMASLNWARASSASSPSTYIFRANISNLKIRARGAVNNVLLLGYSSNAAHTWTNEVTNMEIMVGTGSATVYLRNDTYDNDLIAFINSLAGQTLYYELAEPVVTDISGLLDNRFSAIRCEGNGSITFENDSDYKIPIPNTENFYYREGE